MEGVNFLVKITSPFIKSHFFLISLSLSFSLSTFPRLFQLHQGLEMLARSLNFFVLGTTAFTAVQAQQYAGDEGAVQACQGFPAGVMKCVSPSISRQALSETFVAMSSSV